MGRVEIRNVYKDYTAGAHAVDNFCIDIEDGEFVVLVGPSGCGKSTTLRMVAGLEDITAGEVLIDGTLMNDVHPKDRDIAMVFQNYALYPHMTVAENIGFGLKLRKLSKELINQRVRETAKTIDMETLLDRYPKELSGGQKQRVALGRAIARKPKVFLMDEPLSNLDQKLRAQTRGEINQLAKTLGTTTIYVTHDQVEAMTMADRIVVMDGGKVKQIGTPREVYLRPANKFVAGFIGSPAMNFIQLRVGKDCLKKNDKILNVPKSILQQLKDAGYEDKVITFGIRPESISIEQIGSEKDFPFGIDSEIKIAELLGSESLLHFSFDDDLCIAKIRTFKDFKSGEKIRFCFDMNFSYFFDNETGDRIKAVDYGAYHKILSEEEPDNV